MVTRHARALPVAAEGSLGELSGSVALRVVKRASAAKDKLAEFLRWAQDHPADQWVFRGHSNKKWRLQPSVGRGNSYGLDGERFLLDHFRRLAEPYVTSSELTELDWLSLAQHHGVPTRLLDWTANSLIACFFACATNRSQAGEADGQVVAIEISSVGFFDSKDQSAAGPLGVLSTKLIRPRALAGRIVNQRALFSIRAHPEVPWDVHTNGIRFGTFDIPGDLKELLLRGLHNIGIDDAHVMPDLDGLARMLKWQHEIGILPR